jgi:hypothetical protein
METFIITSFYYFSVTESCAESNLYRFIPVRRNNEEKWREGAGSNLSPGANYLEVSRYFPHSHQASVGIISSN